MSAESVRQWRQANLEKARSYGRESAALWRKRHPERCKEIRNSLKGRWQFFKGKAKSRSIPLELTFEQWVGIVDGAPCHYCHLDITSKGGSLDRKDSKLGYTESNVVPCCTSCNRIRNEDIISYEEMLYIMPLLLAFRNRKES